MYVHREQVQVPWDAPAPEEADDADIDVGLGAGINQTSEKLALVNKSNIRKVGIGERQRGEEGTQADLILHRGNKGDCLHAFVSLKCSSGNLQFPHRVPFTEEKLPWCPCPFKFEAYRPAQVKREMSSLRGQGHFHFARGTLIGKSLSLWEIFGGASRPTFDRNNHGTSLSNCTYLYGNLACKINFFC